MQGHHRLSLPGGPCLWNDVHLTDHFIDIGTLTDCHLPDPAMLEQGDAGSEFAHLFVSPPLSSAHSWDSMQLVQLLQPLGPEGINSV